MKGFIEKFLVILIDKLLKLSKTQKINRIIKEGRLIVGKHTYGVSNLQIDEYVGSFAKVIIGKYCSLGPGIIMITGGNHPTSWVSTFPFRQKWNLEGKLKDGMPYSNGDIVIGNDVWIGTNVTILSGVHIGDGAILAAGSIVSKNIPDYAIVAGNPAKVLKFRFSNEQIEKIKSDPWWEKDESELKKMIKYLQSNPKIVL